MPWECYTVGVNVTACRDVTSRLPGQQDCAQVVDARAELGGLEAGARVLRALGKPSGWAPGWWHGQAAAKAFGAGDKALSYPGALPKCHARDTTDLLSIQHGTVRRSPKIPVIGSLVEQHASCHSYLIIFFVYTQ